MSKFIPDPQIQSLRPMRAGDIAFASGGTVTVGKLSVALLAPEALKSVSPVLTHSVPSISGTPSESPTVGVAITTLYAADAQKSVTVVAVDTTPALSGAPSEFPVIGVGTSTSVV